jgi:hypothetical protein
VEPIYESDERPESVAQALKAGEGEVENRHAKKPPPMTLKRTPFAMTGRLSIPNECGLAALPGSSRGPQYNTHSSLISLE